MAIPLFPVVTLPPGTTSFNLVGLSAGQKYTAVVAHKEDPPSQGYTTPSQVDFTTGTTLGTCATPDDPVAYAFVPPQAAYPLYGFACWNNEPVPGTGIIVQMAVETAPGSNAFGSWLTIDHIAAFPGAWIFRQVSLPTDGCRRAFQAQAYRAGTISSAWTPIVYVLPGTTQVPADYPIAIPTALSGSGGFTPVNVIAPSGMTVAIVSNYTVPTDHDFDHMEYIVQPILGGTPQPQQVVVGSNQGSDVIVAQAVAGGQYQITPVTVSQGATGQQFMPAVPLLRTRNKGGNVLITVPSISNAPHPTLAGIGASTATYSLPFDVGTAYYAAYAVLYPSSPGTIDSVESPNNAISVAPFSLQPFIYPGPGGPSVPVTLGLPGLTTSLPWIVATFVPYNSAGQRGTATTIGPTQRNTSAVPSAPTLSLATFAGTGGTNGGTGPSGGPWNFPGNVGIKVSWATVPAVGDTITLYRSAAQVATHTVAAGEPAAGFCVVVDPTFQAIGTQSYTATQSATSTSGPTSAASAPFAVTLGTGYKLSGLTSVVSSPAGTYGMPSFVSATWNTADGEMPPGAYLTIQYGTSTSGTTPPTAWSNVGTGCVSGQQYQVLFNGGNPASFLWVQAWVAAAGYTNSNTLQAATAG